MKFISERPRLSLSHAERVEKEITKAEVMFVLYGFVLGGLLITQYFFSPLEDPLAD